MDSLGYECFGRAIRPLMAEDGLRPVLYRLPGVTGEYEDAQFYPRS